MGITEPEAWLSLSFSNCPLPRPNLSGLRGVDWEEISSSLTVFEVKGERGSNGVIVFGGVFHFLGFLGNKPGKKPPKVPEK
jgi:hypothetical protein